MNPLLFIGSTMQKQVYLVLAILVAVLTLPTMAVFSLGSDALSFLNSVPNAEAAATQGFYMGGPVPGDTYAWGNCTYWTFAMRLQAGKSIPTSWGNANTWDDNALRDGYEIDHSPTVGAIFQTDEGEFGHVAYITTIDAITGNWTISEMNALHLNVVSTRTFAASSASRYNFIHDKKQVAP